jgi:hypothetical protein
MRRHVVAIARVFESPGTKHSEIRETLCGIGHKQGK